MTYPGTLSIIEPIGSAGFVNPLFGGDWYIYHIRVKNEGTTSVYDIEFSDSLP